MNLIHFPGRVRGPVAEAALVVAAAVAARAVVARGPGPGRAGLAGMHFYTYMQNGFKTQPLFYTF